MTIYDRYRIAVFRRAYRLRAIDMTDEQVIIYLRRERAIRRQINKYLKIREA